MAMVRARPWSSVARGASLPLARECRRQRVARMCTADGKKMPSAYFRKDDPGANLIRTTGMVIGAFLAVGGIYAFAKERTRTSKIRSTGTVLLGGPINMRDAKTGGHVTNEDLKGRFCLLYFGFTHCPDICPSELAKMLEVVDQIEENPRWRGLVQPIFVSIDPRRDTPERLTNYCEGFSSKLMCLTGTDEQIEKLCKDFRVYCLELEVLDADDDEDYLLDHSMVMYLLGPDGKFIDYLGYHLNANAVSDVIKAHLPKPAWQFW